MAFLAQIRENNARENASRKGISRLLGDDWLVPHRLRCGVEEQGSQEKVETQEEKQEPTSCEMIEDTTTGIAAPDLESPAQDPFERYKAMVRFGIPRQVVEGRMRQDGFNPAGLDGPVLEGQIYIALPQVPLSQVPAPSTKRTKKWYWTQVPKADRASPPPEGSVWSRVSEKGATQRLPSAVQTHLLQLYTKDVEASGKNADRESFSSVAAAAEATSIQIASQTVKTGSVKILKGNKGLNLEFAVKHIEVPHATVANDLNLLAAPYIQDTDIKTILAMWPSMAEQRQLDEYSGEYEALGLCEQFFVTIRAVPMVKERLQCAVLKLEFPSLVHELKQSTLLVTRALNQLNSSSKFMNVLRLLRDFGNFINRQDAEAMYSADFSLESLAALTRTSSFTDRTETFFDSFVDIIRLYYGDENAEDNYLVKFHEEINLTVLCKGVSVDALVSELAKLREGYQLVQSVAEASPSTVDTGNQARKAFKDFAEVIDSELRDVQNLLDNLETSKNLFISLYEENDRWSIDRHLKAIALFVTQYKSRLTLPLSRM